MCDEIGGPSPGEPDACLFAPARKGLAVRGGPHGAGLHRQGPGLRQHKEDVRGACIRIMHAHELCICCGLTSYCADIV